MTDFTIGHHSRCHICGERYFEPEGKNCVCWQCRNCNEWFSDFDMLGNREEWLCIYCEDLRYQAEMAIDWPETNEYTKYEKKE